MPIFDSMKTTLTLLGVAASLLLAGCATPPAQPALRTSASFNASKDQVWPLIIAEIGMKYPVRAIEKESGLITTDMVTLASGLFTAREAKQYATLPPVMLGTWNGLRVSYSVMAVEIEPGRTQVSINGHFEAFEDNVTKSWHICRTNGTTEDAILSAIASKLPRPR